MSESFRRRRDDYLLGKVWAFIRRCLAGVGLLTVVLIALLWRAATHTTEAPVAALPERMVLTLTLNSEIGEASAAPTLGTSLFAPPTTLYSVLSAIKAAAKDERVQGILVKIEPMDFNLAQIQELRGAIQGFRKSNKFAWVYADSFGLMSSGMSDYYLASAFDKIYIQPIGTVAITGLHIEQPFAKDTLDKIGVQAQFSHQGAYKSFPEMLTRTGMSPPMREMMTSLGDDLMKQIVRGIAEDRRIPSAKVLEAIDNAPLNDQAALSVRLVDKIAGYEGFIDAALVQGKIDLPQLVTMKSYQDFDRATPAEELLRHTALLQSTPARGVALIYGTGALVSYGAEESSAFSEGQLAADKMCAALKTARKDENIAAVVIRLDTPGGSAEAAETVAHCVAELRARHRPVVVSMGGTAASGGYWIAAAADKIVADPATLTGSIGVFGGKMNLAGLWEKIGLHWDSVSVGKNAGMWSFNQPFTAEEEARFESMLANIYTAFVDRVAQGRKLPRDKVEAIAQGRVWTGAQAKDRGLVDELGGLEAALTLAKQMAKLPEDAPIVEIPPRRAPLEMLFAMLSGEDDATATLPVSSSVTTHVLKTIASLSGPQTARMPPLSVK